MNFKKLFICSLIGATIVAPIVLLILPATFFDHGQSICISKILLDQECPGCGMTRATQHMIHGEFSAAWSYNKLSFVVLPLLVVYWISFLRGEARKMNKKS